MEKNLIVFCVALLVLAARGQSQTLTFFQNISSLPPSTDGQVESIDYSSDGVRLLTSPGRNILLWNRNDNGLYSQGQVISTSDEVQSVKFSHSGSKIAAGSKGSTTFVYKFNPQTNSFEQAQTLLYRSDSSSARITTLSFTANDSKLITGSSDGQINVWNLNSSGAYDFREKLNSNSSEITSLAAQSAYLVSADASANFGPSTSAVTVWIYNSNNDSYATVQRLTPPERIRDLKLSASEQTIVGGGRFGTIYVWKLSSVDYKFAEFQKITNSAESTSVSSVDISSFE